MLPHSEDRTMAIQKVQTLAALAFGLFGLQSAGCSFMSSYGPPADYREVGR